MIEWIPTAIIVAIATASLAVISMGVFVGTLGLVGYYRIKTEAASVATEAAKNAMEEYTRLMNSRNWSRTKQVTSLLNA